MARLETMRCEVCKQEVEIWTSGFNHNRVCPKCEERERLQLKAEALEELSKLTIAERIARIEEWIYDHQHSNLHSRDIGRMMFG